MTDPVTPIENPTEAQQKVERLEAISLRILASGAVPLLFLLLLAAGCGHPRIVVFSTDGSGSTSFDGHQDIQHQLLTTRPAADRIFHVFRTEYEGPDFRLVERDLEGDLLRESTIPRYSFYPSSRFIAVRPDGDAVAYVREGDLRIFDHTTRQESVLIEGVGGAPWIFGGLEWIDPTQLLALLDHDSDNSRPDAVIKVDTRSGAIVGTLELEHPLDFALTPSGRLLAVTQMIRGSGLRVIDVNTLSVVTEIPNPNRRSWMKTPAWSPSETRLAYLDGDDWLSVLTLSDGSVLRSARIPDGHVCYFVGFPRDEQLVYHCGLPLDHGRQQLSFLDLESGQLIKSIEADLIDSCMVLNGGDRIACRIMGAIEVR